MVCEYRPRPAPRPPSSIAGDEKLAVSFSSFSGVGEELGYLLQRSVINASSPHYTTRIFTSASLEPTV